MPPEVIEERFNLLPGRLFSAFMARSGMKNMSVFMDKAFDFAEEASLKDFNYLGPKPYPVTSRTYEAFMEPYIQKKWLKTPLKLMVGAVDKLMGWHKMRKVRRAE